MSDRVPVHMLDPAAAADGQVPTYDAATGRVIWADGSTSGGPTTLDALTDVDTTTTPPSSGQALLYDGGSGLWKPGTVSGGGGGGGGVIVLAPTASIPSTTPAGTVVFRELNRSAAILDDSPAVFLKLDDTSGNWLDASPNARHFAVGAGVTRGKASLVGDSGFAASGSGTTYIGTLANNAGLTGAATMECVVKLPTGNLSGGFMKIGTTGNGWAFGIGGTGTHNVGRQLITGRNGVAYSPTGYSFPDVARTYHVAVTYASSTLTWYIDGVRVGSVTPGAIIAPAAGLFVGADEANNLNSSIDVDNAAFFGSVVPEARIAAHAGINGGRAIGVWDGTALKPLV